MKRVALLLLAATMAAAPLVAETFNATEKFTTEYALDRDGSVWIDNPFGNIEIVGTDAAAVSVTVIKVTRGVDAGALRAGRTLTQLFTRGDNRIRELRTIVPDAPRTMNWQSFVSYSVHAPRNAHIRISSTYSDRIRIADISRDVTVKNVAGEIVLENVRGPVAVDSVNGNVLFTPGVRPASNSQIVTVNGRIVIAVVPEASFQWVADTIQGDFRTTMPVQRARFNGRTFRGLVNGASSPTITTSSLMGDVFLLRTGTTTNQSHSVRNADPDNSPASLGSQQPPLLTRHFQQPVVEGDWQFATNIGNIAVGEVRGDAHVETGAGQVQLDLVSGVCHVVSHGGELDLGDIYGPLTAQTDAGNISVTSARSGGSVVTGGGIIRVLSTGAAMTLRSGGGDIVVRHAGGPVSAETRSGDVNVSIVPASRSEAIEAHTGRGTVVLNVNPRFGADFDVTLVTSNPDTNSILSDLKGLTFRRESVGQRTRIRATGKINGGGQRVSLYAEEGDIRINASPSVVVSPQP